MKKGSHTRRISITVDETTNKVKLSFTPNLQADNRVIMGKHVNGLVNGFAIGLQILLGNETMLRPATKEEVDAHLYVFKDVEKDNALYNARKKLFHELADVMNGVLAGLFPDVKYIEESIEHQQQLVTELTPKEAKAHQEEVQKIVDLVTSMADTTPKGDTDGDNHPL